MCRRWLLAGVCGKWFLVWILFTYEDGRHGCECTDGAVNEVKLLVKREGINYYVFSLSLYPANQRGFRNGS